jgi:predicted RNA-binding protein with PUA-like domain
VANWLLKTEPDDYSYEDLERDGSTRWDGVRSAAALQHIRKMRPGDRAVIYHTGGVKAAVGLADVTSEPYPDPEADDPRRAVVDVSAAGRLPAPVTLATLKADARFAESPLVKIGRLSVVPLTDEQFRVIAGEPLTSGRRRG